MMLKIEAITELLKLVATIVAIAGGIFAFFEYSKSKKARQVDLAVQALKNWDENINIMTGVALSLLREDQREEILPRLKNNQAISFNGEERTSRSFGYLLSDKNEIPANIVAEIHVSLLHYLNAWESIAVLRNTGRVDVNLIDSQLIERNSFMGLFGVLRPYMDLYGKNSWGPLREMFRNIEASKSLERENKSNSRASL